MRRLVRLVPVLAALVVGVTACSDATNGSPVPGGSQSASQPPTGGGTTSSSRTSTSQPSSGESPVADTEPCSLLTNPAKTKLGLSGAGERKDLGGGRECRWRLRGPSETYIFGVVIHDKAGIKDLSSDLEIKQLPDVGSHKAVQNPAKQGGACSVIMGVTDSSRVATTVVAGVDVQKGCDLAMQMAELVEPEIPKA